MITAIIQSNYIPWKGYFDIIHQADNFIFLDDVEYSKGSWRNRNVFKTPEGNKWLTIPLAKKGLNKAKIDEVQLADQNWQVDHLQRLTRSYSEAPFFSEYENLLREIYQETRWSNLSEMNQFTIKRIAKELGISDTRYYNSRDLETTGRKDDRVIELCKTVETTRYISGPSAKSYIDPRKWEEAGIEIVWKKYDYPEYPQLYPPFCHEVTVLDLLFSQGTKSRDSI